MKIGRAPIFSESELIRVGITARMRPACACHCALDHRQTNAAQTNDRDGIPDRDLRRDMHRADTGGEYAAAQALYP